MYKRIIIILLIVLILLIISFNKQLFFKQKKSEQIFKINKKFTYPKYKKFKDYSKLLSIYNPNYIPDNEDIDQILDDGNYLIKSVKGKICNVNSDNKIVCDNKKMVFTVKNIGNNNIELSAGNKICYGIGSSLYNIDNNNLKKYLTVIDRDNGIISLHSNNNLVKSLENVNKDNIYPLNQLSANLNKYVLIDSSDRYIFERIDK
jgi:hypothetical protein